MIGVPSNPAHSPVTMLASIYARSSTDKQDAGSIADQLRVCTERATREGWSISDHYIDEAISGAAIGNRPAFQALMKDAEARRFDVLLVMDLTRLSRSAGDLNKTIDRLVFRGIRVIAASNGYDSERKGHKIQASFEGTMGEMFREMIRDKTYAALRGRAEVGALTGGRSFGYSTARAGSAVVRVVDPAEADTVPTIFELYAEGRSPQWIAADLNRRRVPSPRRGTWASSAIYGDSQDGSGVLNNELYVGVQVWNRREWRKHPDTGRRAYVRRPESEWIRTSNEAWRVVDDALWERVKKRQAAVREQSASIRAALHRNARTGAGPKYLFSGLLACARCGSNFVICGANAYGCASNVARGAAVCDNRKRVSRRLVESRLLQAIKTELFKPEAIELFVAETTRLLREAARSHKPVLDEVTKQLAAAERQVENLLDAIRAGIITASTKEALVQAERDRDRMRYELALREAPASHFADVLPDAVQRYTAMLEDLASTLQRDVARARYQLKELLGTVRMHPRDGYLEAELTGSFGGLLSLASEQGRQTKINLVAGTGFEPVTFGL